MFDKKSLDSFCKFRIGQVVALKVQMLQAESQAAVEPTKGFGTVANAPMPLIINGRQVEECPGGFQVHYTIRLDPARPSLVNEIELIPYDDNLLVPYKKLAERKQT